jgi:hypothetical protein
MRLNPRTCDVIDRARREHYEIRRCTRCGGPELHSKERPAAKCLRCGAYRELAAITPYERQWTCGACRRRFWAVLGTGTCAGCAAKRERRSALVRKWGPDSPKHTARTLDFIGAI